MKSVDTAILFDLDGTLVDTVYAHVVAWSHALRSVGIVVPDWKIHRRIGMSGTSLVHQILREDDNLSRKADIGLLEKGTILHSLRPAVIFSFFRDPRNCCAF
jgi:beta-phosphoglucomutase-like phosphatase (HAD superfamily)